MKADELARLLPAVLQSGAAQGSPMRALLEAMAALHQPDEDLLDRIGQHFDPRSCSSAMATYLASWVGIDWLLPSTGPPAGSTESFPTGAGRLRETIATASQTTRWQGTERGLIMMLEAATGCRGFAITTPDPQSSFRQRLLAPAEASTFAELVERIVRSEKPAHIVMDVVFAAPGGGTAETAETTGPAAGVHY